MWPPAHPQPGHRMSVTGSTVRPGGAYAEPFIAHLRERSMVGRSVTRGAMVVGLRRSRPVPSAEGGRAVGLAASRPVRVRVVHPRRESGEAAGAIVGVPVLPRPRPRTAEGP
jgi:hypothetical protein